MISPIGCAYGSRQQREGLRPLRPRLDQPYRHACQMPELRHLPLAGQAHHQHLRGVRPHMVLQVGSGPAQVPPLQDQGVDGLLRQGEGRVPQVQRDRQGAGRDTALPPRGRMREDLHGHGGPAVHCHKDSEERGLQRQDPQHVDRFWNRGRSPWFDQKSSLLSILTTASTTSRPFSILSIAWSSVMPGPVMPNPTGLPYSSSRTGRRRPRRAWSRR